MTTTSPVLVTGASGFIATHCIVKLIEAGYAVRGTLRSPNRADSIRAAVGRGLGREVTDDELSFAVTDLMKDEGWAEAVAGCDYVLHVASPLPRKPPKHKDELIVPARDGALRVLRAAADAGVKRVVMTSSVAAVIYGHARDGSRVYDENDWTEIGDDVGAYEQSKTIAERAAWEFVDGLPDGSLELVTINPGLVLGPILDEDYGTSGEVVRKLMRRELPGLPDVGWAMVDVRDVADAHVAALAADDAAGKRFIAAIEHASMSDVADILRETFAERGYKIPSRRLPGWVLRVASLFDKTARLAVPELGKRQDLSNQQIREVLGWQPRSLEQMVVDMGESMIEHGVV